MKYNALAIAKDFININIYKEINTMNFYLLISSIYSIPYLNEILGNLGCLIYFSMELPSTGLLFNIYYIICF